VTGTRLISTIATGTAPLQVASTTMVTNLNADRLDGFHATTFATLGANLFVGDQAITGKLAAVGSTTAHNSAIVYAIQNGASDSDWTVGSYPAAAIRGDATTLSSYAAGVLGTAQTNDAVGVGGFNTDGIAVGGVSIGPNPGAGVVGWCEQGTAECIGVVSFLRMQGKLFEGRVAADSTDDEGVPKFTVASDGHIYTAGKVNIYATGTTGRELEVNGGLRLITTKVKPTCNANARGTFWVTQGAPGQADLVEVCTKDAADAYGWRTVI
jgi:hypothetical protein